MTTITPHLTDTQAQLLVDGVLESGEAAILEGHLAGCAECRVTVDGYRALASALDDLELAPPPADFTAGVLARIDSVERAAARERRHAIAILAAVLAASATAFAVAGPAAWAPLVASTADALAGAARTVEVGARFVPTLVSALRFEIILVAAALALPLLLALVRLMPAPTPPEVETA
jgi:predicted anti-sigma-YlaC factor YlaD